MRRTTMRPQEVMEILTWVRQQLAADERTALAAAARNGRQADWAAEEWHGSTDGEPKALLTTRHLGAITPDPIDRVVVEHIVCHDPARVLAEIDTKRQRIMLIVSTLTHKPASDTAYELAQLEALPFAGRPGYREAWRPQP